MKKEPEIVKSSRQPQSVDRWGTFEMRNYLTIVALILFSVFIWSCQSNKLIGQQRVITKSCELIDRLGDTVVIEGIYSTCIEYSSFQTIKKDRCFVDYQMELELSGENLNPDLIHDIYKMDDCNASRRLIVRGTFEKNQFGYGHLNSNNTKINVIEILEYDDIKYSKIK